MQLSLEKIYHHFLNNRSITNEQIDFVKEYLDSGLLLSESSTADFKYSQIFYILKRYIDHGLIDQEICNHHIKMFALDIDIYDIRSRYQDKIKTVDYRDVFAEFKEKLQIDLFTYIEEIEKKQGNSKLRYLPNIIFDEAIDIIFQYMGWDIDINLPSDYQQLNTINIPFNDYDEIISRLKEATSDPYKINLSVNQCKLLDNIYKTYGYVDTSSNEYILPNINVNNEIMIWLFLLSIDKVKNPLAYKYFLQPRRIKIPENFYEHRPFKTLENQIKKSSLVNNNSGSFDRFSIFLWELKNKLHPVHITQDDVKEFYLTFINELNNITDTVYDKDYFSPTYFNKPKNKRRTGQDPWMRWRDSRKTSKDRLK